MHWSRVAQDRAHRRDVVNGSKPCASTEVGKFQVWAGANSTTSCDSFNYFLTRFTVTHSQKHSFGTTVEQ
jgi:hypothetical protein